MSKQISPEVRALLDMAIVSGKAVLPLPMADRPVYDELNEIFVRLRGQWKKGKGHVFPYDPTAALEAVRLGGVMPDKNPLAYFPTPRELAEFIANESDEPFGGAIAMLEPSAGWGSMIDAARKRWPDIKVTAVELDALNVATLRAKGILVIEADFLAHDFGEQRFCIILMNPPFSTKADRNVWVAHLRKAFDLLAPDGELSCIVPSGMWQGSGLRLFVELREWLLLHGATIEAHSDGAFKESGTGVKTATIKMSKPASWRPQDILHESNTLWMVVDSDAKLAERVRKLKLLSSDSSEVQAFFRDAATSSNSEGCSVAMTPEMIAELGRDWDVEHGHTVAHRDTKPSNGPGQLDLL
jgi:predicted RNA methylase